MPRLEQVASEPSDDQLYRTVGDTIERVRAGDQVAMSLLIESRKNAARGVPRARRAVAMAWHYLDNNPPVRFGGTSAENSPEVIRLWSLDTALAGGVDKSTVQTALVTDLTHVSFWQAVAALVHMPLAALEGLKFPDSLSKVVRLAAHIRAIANPDVPLSTLCPATAWELGEE